MATTKTTQITLQELKSMTTAQLQSLANCDNTADMHALITTIISQSRHTITAKGILEKIAGNTNPNDRNARNNRDGGFGFIRFPENSYAMTNFDVHVPKQALDKFSFRMGDEIEVELGTPVNKKLNNFSVSRILTKNNTKPRPHFNDFTPTYPDKRFTLEMEGNPDITGRIIDLIAPIGFGQRALITAPPRTGKTMLLQNIAKSIHHNHPEVKIMVLLIDERPEEVTDMQRNVNGIVLSSTFDEHASRHTHVSKMAIERAKRMVEDGDDVVILLDSITRLGRSFNTTAPNSGKVLTGGIDSNALQIPKRFFGAARNVENGGSLTIIATGLIETGSRMDEVIFEEFKGTGNSEIILDRNISNKRIFPSIDIVKSGTRKEELLIPKDELNRTNILRRAISNQKMNSLEAIEFLIEKIKNTKNNAEFFDLMNV